MSVTFSDQLILRYQRYMEQRYGVSIPSEEAQVHLASFSRLHTLFSFQETDGQEDEELSSNPHLL